MSLDGFVNDARGSVEALYRDLADWRNTEQGKGEHRGHRRRAHGPPDL